MTQNTTEQVTIEQAGLEPVDDAAWQQATTDEDRRFWNELEPNLEPSLAESVRRMYLRNEAVRRMYLRNEAVRQAPPISADGHMDLERFFGILLVDGLTERERMLARIELAINKT